MAAGAGEEGEHQDGVSPGDSYPDERAVFPVAKQRILGGIQIKQYLRTYMASVQVNGKHQCGGLLISPQWVLTAAHCQPDNIFSTFRVLLGAYSLTENEPYKKYFQVQTQIAHPSYDATNNHNDIMLLQLNETATLNRAVKPLPFQREDVDLVPKTMCRVAGWGKISTTGRVPDKLYEVEVPIIDRETCNRRDHYDNEVTKNMLCAGDKKKDSCEGDSGGPLICDEIAVGIVSYGSRKCGKIKKPGVYTRISAYTAWIDSVLQKYRSKRASRAIAEDVMGLVRKVPLPVP